MPIITCIVGRASVQRSGGPAETVKDRKLPDEGAIRTTSPQKQAA